MNNRQKIAVKIVVIIFVPIAFGFLLTLGIPWFGTLVARALLDTIDEIVRLPLLFVAGLLTLIVRGIAQERPKTSWIKVWKVVKLAWKVYGLILVASILFAVGAFIADRLLT
ncbi:MAG TPA: hypothetical protein VKV95_04465 [Terriglobia bacterium]|nr:hypothetical protein [Terriglobia bacterium]